MKSSSKSRAGITLTSQETKKKKREKGDVEKEGMIPLSVSLPLGKLKRALLIDCEDFTLQYGFRKPEKHHENLVFNSRKHLKSGTKAGKSRKKVCGNKGR
jgi:hypothetical protein